MSYNYNYNVGTGTGVLAGATAIPVTIVSLALTVVMIVALWKIFEKCGVEGWKSIIPIYNIVVLFQIVGLSPWYIALALIPCVGPIIFLVYSYIAYIKLAKKLGKTGTGFTLLIIFFTPIALMILAFDKNCVVNNGMEQQVNNQQPIQTPVNDVNMNQQQGPVGYNPMQQQPMQQPIQTPVNNVNMEQPQQPIQTPVNNVNMEQPQQPIQTPPVQEPTQTPPVQEPIQTLENQIPNVENNTDNQINNNIDQQ